MSRSRMVMMMPNKIEELERRIERLEKLLEITPQYDLDVFSPAGGKTIDPLEINPWTGNPGDTWGSSDALVPNASMTSAGGKN